MGQIGHVLSVRIHRVGRNDRHGVSSNRYLNDMYALAAQDCCYTEQCDLLFATDEYFGSYCV